MDKKYRVPRGFRLKVNQKNHNFVIELYKKKAYNKSKFNT